MVPWAAAPWERVGAVPVLQGELTALRRPAGPAPLRHYRQCE
ncbi:hypothetical protein ACS15_3546 [Ralstonia insidiosa]|uniref:Uncharacterized protein n=1 Tax=Ralstonia insidiosa TaxID=190721 RepID=A0AAC9BDP3_9RALS|nr:hypothetical protein ACS15_3546 [Ralstonia insidiosa]